MGRRSKAGKIPKWHKGQLLRDTLDGFWFGSREGKLFQQEGKLVSKKNFDTVTDKDRQEALRKNLSS